MRRRYLLLLVLLLTVWVSVSCSMSRAARKQRLLSRGEKLVLEGSYRQASDLFAQAIDLDQGFVAAHYALGNVSLKLGDQDSAFYEFQQVVELAPENGEGRLKYGYLQLVRGNAREAQKQADTILQKQETSADAHLLMTQALLMQKEVDEALRHLHRAMELAADKPAPYVVQARIELATGNLSQAEKTYLTALQKGPNDIDAMLGLSVLYQMQSRWGDAESYLWRAIQADRFDPQPRVSLVLLYLAASLPQKAQDVAAQAKAQIPDNPTAYRLPGNLYIWTGELQKAISEYGEVVRTYPQDTDSKKIYVQLLIISNNNEEAERLNNELMAALGSDAEALAQKGELLIKKGRSEDAAVPLKEALRDDPNSYMAHYYLGVAFDLSDDYEGAAREWREASRLQPGRAEPQLALARLAEAIGDVTKLGVASEQLLKIAPNRAITYIVRAQADMARKDMAAAEVDFRKAIELQPKDPNAYSLLAELKISQKKLPEAETLLEQALTQDPNHYRSLQLLCTIYVRDGQAGKALQRLNSQIAIAPTNARYHVLAGALQLGQGDAASAGKSLQKAVSLDAKSAEAYRLLGQIRVQNKDPDGAILVYDEWARNVSSDDRPFLLAGQLCDTLDQWERAQNYYRKALQRNPRNGMAANNLAYSMLDHVGDPKTAVSYALLAVKWDPNSPVAQDTLGWAYYRYGDYSLAISTLQKAMDGSPRNATIRFHLGRSYQKIREWAKAKSMYQSALEIDPRSSHADEIRRAIQETENQQGGIGGVVSKP